jgi:hypothetical protein
MPFTLSFLSSAFKEKKWIERRTSDITNLTKSSTKRRRRRFQANKRRAGPKSRSKEKTRILINLHDKCKKIGRKEN